MKYKIEQDNWLINILITKAEERGNLMTGGWPWDPTVKILSFLDMAGDVEDYEITIIDDRVITIDRISFFLSDFGIPVEQMPFYVSVFEE
jgi:hypothetical protein